MRLLVCGGRDYADVDALEQYLISLAERTKVSVVIHGCARGVDSLAAAWATKHGVHVAGVPALWDYHGKGAGYKRNAAMLALCPDLVVAFPGGKGTASMVSLAQKAGIKVVYPTGGENE